MSEAMLDVRGLVRVYTQAATRLEVLRGVSFAVREGEMVALVGPSGAGKSTILHTVGLLEKAQDGVIRIGGEDVGRLSDSERTALRRRSIGFVYQFHHLLPEFSALENIVLPQMIGGVPRHEAALRAQELLDLVGLAQRAAHRPARLSGGEQQRVAIARALANRPKLLIADEPTGNLDPHTAEGVFDMLRGLVARGGFGALVATHNLELARRMDRVLELRDGVVVASAP
ncbi:ABC transporter ATP-binding protein [Arenibaculum pallidiluteum]|uniref:ABC transporter ATP-binding protein n=1 Tax=Arenibaculum pallidiluteum TaxID=2812559 RepID=UPI001A97A852|nr:ABC transporter ATP-binding protein [Arenibaculum pallidiluteum]